jgi:hypothetical protein
MRRWKERYELYGYDGLFDRRLGKPSPKRVPLATMEAILRLYQEQYADFNVRHFHEKLREKHHIQLSYTWVKRALQMAGLVKVCRSYFCRLAKIVSVQLDFNRSRLLQGKMHFALESARFGCETSEHRMPLTPSHTLRQKDGDARP